MSVQTLPRWQRAVLRWFLERKIRKGKRALPCPQCQGLVRLPHQLNEALWDMLVTCPHCGHAAPLMEFSADQNKTPEEKLAEGRIATTHPTATRITVEDTGSSRIWTLPAKGGCNFLLVFGIFWFLFSSAFLVAMAFGTLVEGSWLAGVLVVGAFILVGVGLIYGGLSLSYAHHVLTVDAVELIHERRMLGRAKRKSLPRDDISSIELVVFYSENYKPVHGIEIKAGRRKIRFGSRLTPEEKAWLCEELRSAVSLHHAATSSRDQSTSLRDTSSVLGSAPNNRIEVELHGQGCVIQVTPGKHGKIVMAIGGVFVAMATFMITMGARMWISDADGPPLFFRLLWNGFCLFWCGGVALFGVMGLAGMIAGWRMNRTSFRITASPDALQILEYYGQDQHETLVPASMVQDIRTSLFQTVQSSSGNEKSSEPKHRGVIVLEDRVIGFGGGCSLHELNTAIAALNATLGRTSLPE